MLSIEERRAIHKYKKYAEKYFANKQTLTDYTCPEYNENANFADYLNFLKKYKRRLSTYIELRNRHYDNFILNKKPEDIGHKIWREGLIDILNNCQATYEYWMSIKHQQEKLSEESSELSEEDISDNDEHEEEHTEGKEIESVEFRHEKPYDWFTDEILDLIHHAHEEFRKERGIFLKGIVDHPTTINNMSSLEFHVIDLVLSELISLNRKYIGTDEQKYEFVRSTIYLDNATLINVIALDPELKPFILTIAYQLFIINKRKIDLITNRLDKILSIFDDYKEILFETSRLRLNDMLRNKVPLNILEEGPRFVNSFIDRVGIIKIKQNIDLFRSFTKFGVTFYQNYKHILKSSVKRNEDLIQQYIIYGFDYTPEKTHIKVKKIYKDNHFEDLSIECEIIYQKKEYEVIIEIEIIFTLIMNYMQESGFLSDELFLRSNMDPSKVLPDHNLIAEYNRTLIDFNNFFLELSFQCTAHRLFYYIEQKHVSMNWKEFQDILFLIIPR